MPNQSANDSFPQAVDPLGGQLAVPLCQVPKLLGCGKSKAEKMVRDGTLESVKVGRTRLVSARSLRALVYGEAA